MSINFVTLKGLEIPEGIVTQITDASGIVLWNAVKKVKVTITSTFNGMDGDTARITVNSSSPFAPDPTNPNNKVTSWTVQVSDMPDCTIEIPVGSTIECYVTRNKGNADSFIKLNGSKVVTGEGTYIYTVTKDVTVDVSDKYIQGEYGTITITEVGAPGLYDANDNLIADWDTLVNTYGLDIEKEYASNTASENAYTTTLTSGYCVFNNHSALANGRTLKISDSVTNIGTFSLCGCESLTNIIIPNTVQNISMGALQMCHSLTDLTIPESVKTLGLGPFTDCTSLTKVIFKGKPTLSELMGGYPLFNLCSALTDIYVPWAEGEVPGAPWEAPNATIHYNSEV